MGPLCGSSGLGTALAAVGDRHLALGVTILCWRFSKLALVCSTADAELLRLFAAYTSCFSSAKDTCIGAYFDGRTSL